MSLIPPPDVEDVVSKGFTIQTINGAIHVQVTVDLHEVARQLADKAQASKSGKVRAIFGAVTVTAPRRKR